MYPASHSLSVKDWTILSRPVTIVPADTHPPVPITKQSSQVLQLAVQDLLKSNDVRIEDSQCVHEPGTSFRPRSLRPRVAVVLARFLDGSAWRNGDWMSVESIESSGTQSRISLLVGVLHLLSAERSFNSHVDGHYADGLALRR
jgi:hypothetical protein